MVIATNTVDRLSAKIAFYCERWHKPCISHAGTCMYLFQPRRAIMMRFTRRTVLAVCAAAVSAAWFPAHAADPIRIGLVTALSGQSAQSGEAITRGMTIAIDEINAKGGLLGGR